MPSWWNFLFCHLAATVPPSTRAGEASRLMHLNAATRLPLHAAARVTRTRRVHAPPHRGAYVTDSLCVLSRLQRSAAAHLNVQDALEVFLFLSARCTQTPRQMTERGVILSNNCERRSDVVIGLPLNFNWLWWRCGGGVVNWSRTYNNLLVILFQCANVGATQARRCLQHNEFWKMLNLKAEKYILHLFIARCIKLKMPALFSKCIESIKCWSGLQYRAKSRSD